MRINILGFLKNINIKIMRKGNFDGHYIKWRKSRIAVTLDHYGSDFFKGKTLLEIGAGWGDTGNEFSKLGAKVTVSDAREEHMIEAAKRYPHINCVTVDAESREWEYDVDMFDIIIHWGVLYHLQNPQENIELFAKHCKEMCFETEVADSDDSKYILFRDEQTRWDAGAWGMAFSGTGCLPSYAYVEKMLSDNNFDWERLKNPTRANAEFHHYDWKRENNKKWRSGQRAFWFTKIK